MMSKYAFALVLGTEEVDGVTWYHISQSGTEGYVMGNYFKVLTLGELTEFLTSDEYRQSAANSGSESETTSVITPVEDFNSGVWKNPGTVQASYQPFTPVVTPTVNVEQIVTPTVAPTATPTPTVAPLSTTNFTEFTTAAPTTKSSGSGWLWIGLAAIAVLAGGGIYGYSIYRANQRRAAQRAAQRRQAQQQARAAQQNAYARPTQQYPQQNQAAQQPSVFTPPTPTQQTGASSYTSASQQSAKNPYQPQQSGTTQASSAGGTRHRRSDRHQG
jgi:Tfp pilus assembly protein PilE